MKQTNAQLTTIIIAALFAAAAGYAAVQVGLGPSGPTLTAPGESAPPQAQPSSSGQAALAPAKPGGSSGGSGLARLAHGPMANLLVAADPKPMPDLSFRDGEGQAKSLADWRGRVVLLNLWATWCGPCKHEMPALDRLQAALPGNDFTVLALSVDRTGLEAPRTFFKTRGITHVTLLNDETSQAGGKLKAIGLPVTLLVDREGREIARLTGPAEWDAKEAIAVIKAAIAGKPE